MGASLLAAWLLGIAGPGQAMSPLVLARGLDLGSPGLGPMLRYHLISITRLDRRQCRQLG